MSNLDKQIVSAIKILIRRNGGEIHGFWSDIADKIACQVGGNPDDYIVQKYEEYLRNLGLKYFFEDHPDICFMRGMQGELNFIDRKLVYDVVN
jgi:hypothetical protein